MTGLTVCVTGANGFIGGHVVEEFLRQGCTVRAAVHPPAADVAFLAELGAAHHGSGGALQIVTGPELSTPNSFDAAVAGCDVVVHTAAVVKVTFDKDPHAEIISPNVEGVRHVVSACRKGGVRRIVYTSATSTVLTIDKHRAAALRGTPVTEAESVTHFTPTYAPFGYGAIAAERLLGELWDGECVRLLPSVVLGPQQNGDVLTSNKLLHQIVRGGPSPPMPTHVVDVRDVARAHYFAAAAPAGAAVLAGGRFLVAPNEVTEMAALIGMVQAADAALKVKPAPLPWAALWGASWFLKKVPLTKYFLYEKYAPQPRLSNAKLCAAGFAFEHPDPAATVRDAVDSFKRFGIDKKEVHKL
jgi:nucleoside-diphosphate-sugar epimerase